MKNQHFFLAIFFLVSITISAQEKNNKTSLKPVSIYTFSGFSNDKNSFSAINNKLKLTGFKFVIVNQLDLDLNQVSINTNTFGRKPSELIYDDYKRYQDRNLLKGFLLKNDPTRWNLQCRQPNLQL